MEKKTFFNVPLKNKVSMEITTMSNSTIETVSIPTIYFVLSGWIELFHNGKGVTLKKGEIYIVNSFDLVGIVADKNNFVLITTVDFNNQYKLTNPISPLYMKEAYEKISNILASTFLESSVSEIGSEEIVEGNIFRLIGFFKRYIPVNDSQNEREMTNSLNDKNREVIEYINKHFSEEISLDFLANRLFISKYYLAHSFKQQVGLTIGNFIKEIRLIHGYQLIENTNRPVSQIAIDLGFSNDRSFSEGFKKKYGLTPTTFRKTNIKTGGILVDYEKADELEIMKILNNYAGREKISYLEINQSQEMKIKVNSEFLLKKLSVNNIFIRLEDPSLRSKLIQIKRLNITKYVSVRNISDSLDIRIEDERIKFDTKYILRTLKKIVDEGLYPYIQIDTFDFDRIYNLSKKIEDFDYIMNQLFLDIERNFVKTKKWKVEFRCFYEMSNSYRLCLPMKKVVVNARYIGQTIVYFPNHPKLSEHNEHKKIKMTIYILDDKATIKKYDYQQVLNLLDDPKYLESVNINKNFLLQNIIGTYMEKLEKDYYYKQFTNLIYASQMLYLFINNCLKDVMTNEPVTLDGSTLFSYFPEKVSRKLSLLSDSGVRQDMWFAYQFKMSLFDEVVFNNEYCIITKRNNNYRIIAIYPKKISYTQKTEGRQKPNINITIDFEGLKGNYQIVEQKMTPKEKDWVNKNWNTENSLKLSFELNEYLDDVSQPVISIKDEYIEKDYSYSLNLPLFGVSYIEVNKLS